MRLREFAPSQDPTRAEAAALMTVLQHLQAENGEGAEVPFTDLSNAMNQAGYPFTYRQFQDLLGKIPSVKNMVGAHSERAITIGQTPKPSPDAPPPETTVDKMASRAAADAINK